jgi:hypothetical protein
MFDFFPPSIERISHRCGAWHSRGADPADPSETLAHAGPEGRLMAIDPFAVLPGNLRALQDAEHVGPGRRRAGIDRLVRDLRESLRDRRDPLCQCVRDREWRGRERVGRDHKPARNKRRRRRQKRLPDPLHQARIAREPADGVEAPVPIS